jgi:cytoskeleton protein RodZ
MMTQTVNHAGNEVGSEAGDEATDKNIDFGSLLAEARKAKNFTVEEVSEHLKINARTITALETNDKEALPAATFTQGYIRTYAKFLEISEDTVLDIYKHAVPHDDVSDLKPRSNLPGEASSQSPLIKAITILLIIAGIAAIGFGSFQYYQEKAGVMESELDTKEDRFTGNSLDSPGSRPLSIKQDARMTENGELIVEKTDPFEYMAEKTPTGDTASEETANTAVEDSAARSADDRADNINIQAETAQTAVVNDNNNDIIEIFAENGSWIEVRDANKSRLLYNMLPAGSSRALQGQAPFSITMGNAQTTRVVINGIEVDVTDYIRPNNTASFKVSTQEQNIIFH